MAEPAVAVDGLRELRKALKEAGDDGVDLKAANREAGDTVAQAARSLVPRLTGRLQNSIRPVGAVAGVAVKAGRASLPYAGVIHFGWPAHNIRPQPFLYEAIDRRRGAVIDAYQDAVQAVADRVARAT